MNHLVQCTVPAGGNQQITSYSWPQTASSPFAGHSPPWIHDLAALPRLFGNVALPLPFENQLNVTVSLRLGSRLSRSIPGSLRYRTTRMPAEARGTGDSLAAGGCTEWGRESTKRGLGFFRLFKERTLLNNPFHSR